MLSHGLDLFREAAHGTAVAPTINLHCMSCLPADATGPQSKATHTSPQSATASRFTAEQLHHHQLQLQLRLGPHKWFVLPAQFSWQPLPCRSWRPATRCASTACTRRRTARIWPWLCMWACLGTTSPAARCLLLDPGLQPVLLFEGVRCTLAMLFRGCAWSGFWPSCGGCCVCGVGPVPEALACIVGCPVTACQGLCLRPDARALCLEHKWKQALVTGARPLSTLL